MCTKFQIFIFNWVSWPCKDHVNHYILTSLKSHPNIRTPGKNMLIWDTKYQVVRDKHLIDNFKSLKFSCLVWLAVGLFSSSLPLLEYERENVNCCWFVKFGDSDKRFLLIIAMSNAMQSHVNTIPNTNKYGKEIIITNRWSAITKKGANSKVLSFSSLGMISIIHVRNVRKPAITDQTR